MVRSKTFSEPDTGPSPFFFILKRIVFALVFTVCACVPFTAIYADYAPYGPLPHPSMSKSKARLANGKFLVAGRDMRDPRFANSVILLVEYSWHGATGLIINRPTDITTSAALPGIKGLKGETDRLYFGGPVDTGRIFLLFRSSQGIEGSERIFEDLYVSESGDVLKILMDDKKSERFHLYAGYAGWAPEQLDQEVSMGVWDVLPGDVETVFDRNPLEVWQRLIH